MIPVTIVSPDSQGFSEREMLQDTDWLVCDFYRDRHTQFQIWIYDSNVTACCKKDEEGNVQKVGSVIANVGFIELTSGTIVHVPAQLSFI
jgi:hypothetical protein